MGSVGRTSFSLSYQNSVFGQAMVEEVIYGEDGKLLTATLMDSAILLLLSENYTLFIPSGE